MTRSSMRAAAGNFPHMTDVLRRRIKERLSALKLTPRAASLKAGLGPDLIRDLLRRPENRLLSDSLHRIAGALETTSSYLLGETGAPEPARSRARRSEFVPIRKIAIEAEFGGQVRLVVDPDAPVLHWREEWVARFLAGRGADGRYLVLEGDSYVEGLNDGDVLCMDVTRIDPARDPGIYCLYDGGAIVVRRLQLVAGQREKIRVLSDNARYPSYEVDGSQAQILGRVVWRAGGL